METMQGQSLQQHFFLLLMHLSHHWVSHIGI
ncbi:hypothetical protein Godav_011817 [Gossypium davidsonii]|uniref:Uncharacterized protein n=1 Tax=Gossypium davidsonii TaxID=34287 RepID=A0A7J8RB88_GOSDV|nr:hypothetical protein [Gossypium davidsonii]